MTRRLISFQATVIAELDISMGAPTISDVGHLIMGGNFSIETSEPLDGTGTIIIRANSLDNTEKEPDDE